MNETKTLRILYFCSSGIYGGAENFVEHCLENHKSDAAIDATALLLNSGPFLDRLKKNGLPHRVSPIKVKLRNPISWFLFQIWFFKFLRDEKIDIVHTTMPYSQIYASIAAKFANVKIVWFQHGPVGGFLDKLASFFPVNGILFNSQYTYSEHIRTTGSFTKPFQIINPPVIVKLDSSHIQEIRSSYSSTGGHLFVSAGRICRWKGYETAIMAISSLVKEHCLECKLLVIGQASTSDDKKYYAELMQLVDSIELSEQVIFLGFQERVHDFIAAADFLLHTSNIPEPFGLVIAEAKKVGTYIFAPNLGGAREQLYNFNELGCLYDPNFKEIDLTKKILACISTSASTSTKNMAQIQGQDLDIFLFLKNFYYNLS